MKTIKTLGSTIGILALCLLSCSKVDSSEVDLIGEQTYLQFKTANGKSDDTIYYTKWLKSGFPNSSKLASEIWDLPLIKHDYFNPTKDLIMVYGRKGNIFSIPVTLPQDNESYSVELIQGANGTTTRLRVTSLDLTGLQDIFFRPSGGASFRIVIVPSQKLLGLKASGLKNLEKMSHEEIATYFGIRD
ncbi:MAG: hypothetical protein AB3N16_15975 [Flavobacteriaceae bacterium]